jgi:hypothetical protein
MDLDLLLRTYASRRVLPALLQNQTSICGLELRRAVTEVDLAFLVYTTRHVLHAIADRLLVNIQSESPMRNSGRSNVYNMYGSGFGNMGSRSAN